MNIYDDIIKNEILNGLLQVDKTFMLKSVDMAHDRETRKLNIAFIASTASGEEVNEVIKYN